MLVQEAAPELQAAGCWTPKPESALVLAWADTEVPQALAETGADVKWAGALGLAPGRLVFAEERTRVQPGYKTSYRIWRPCHCSQPLNKPTVKVPRPSPPITPPQKESDISLSFLKPRLAGPGLGVGWGGSRWHWESHSPCLSSP